MLPETPKSEPIHVAVSDDRLSAELIIPYNVDLSSVSVESVQPLLAEAKVEFNDQVRQRIEKLLSLERTPGQSLRGVIAQGKPSKAGVDGRVEWTIDNEHDHQTERVNSYYERSAFIMVEKGQPLGKVYPPTPGEPGFDVTGAALNPTPGRAANFRHDDSITQEDDGLLLAAVAGQLVHSERNARIQQVLTIDDAVDFSTGNIDFQGSVVVRRGVKDRFVVKATENIEIQSMVEAATLECGGDLVLDGGFAGRELGAAQVGGNMRARYLDGVKAEVRGDLTIAREMINCDLTVHGNVVVTAGSIIGGRLVVTGKLAAANLGSGGSVMTNIVIGTVPRLEPMLKELKELRDEYLRRIKANEQQQQLMEQMSKRDRELEVNRQRFAQLKMAHKALSAKRDRLQETRVTLEQKVESLRVVDVRVERVLHEGVFIHYGTHAYRISREQPGPVRLLLDPDGVLIYKTQSGGGPILSIAEQMSRRKVA